MKTVRAKTHEDDWFNVTKSERQSGVISALLFVMLMDRCMKQLRYGDEVIALAYADDISPFIIILVMLQDSLNNWNDDLDRSGMKINTNKREVLMVAREKYDIDIRIDGVQLKLVM